jgi:PhnB protein
MASKLNPYLSFKDNTREAMDFYKSVFGGTLTTNTFKELGGAQDPSEDDLVMHSALEVSNGITIMASDTPARMEFSGHTGFSMSLSGEGADEAELTGWFNKLAAGGTVTMPLNKAIWGDTFGMCVDRFGVNWLVNISGAGGGGATS